MRLQPRCFNVTRTMNILNNGASPSVNGCISTWTCGRRWEGQKGAGEGAGQMQSTLLLTPPLYLLLWRRVRKSDSERRLFVAARKEAWFQAGAKLSACSTTLWSSNSITSRQMRSPRRGGVGGNRYQVVLACVGQAVQQFVVQPSLQGE